jgi:hypothetical protein
LNRASPISDIENLDLPSLRFYGKMWEEELKRTDAKIKELKAKT